MPHSEHDLRIGKLLMAAEIISDEDLDAALDIAEFKSEPVGRFLVKAGRVTERELQAAIQVQSLMRDSLVKYEVGIRALSVFSVEEVSLDEALSRVGWELTDESLTNKLGELLLAAGVATQDQLDEAFELSEVSGLPLGRTLRAVGVLSDELLHIALRIQVLIREGKLSRNDGIAGIRSAFDRRKVSADRSA